MLEFPDWRVKVMNSFEYESVGPSTREELVRQLSSRDPKVVANALYAASKYELDSIWVQDQCLKFLTSPEVTVRWAAATCLGDLAFLQRPLDVEIVVSALERAAHDSEIADPAQFSISLVKQYGGPK
jgi:hypothetical protein